MDKKEPEAEKIVIEATRDVEQGLTGVAAPPDSHGPHSDHKKRTWGNKIFDLAVWPTIAFAAVYGISTWAVKSAKDAGSGMSKLYEGIAESVENIAKVKPTQSHNLALVLISFAVGTILMAPIKLLEDRRGKISKWIDEKLGTAHDDPAHYAKEPKQTWKSVLGGRLVTFLSVLGISFSVGEKRTEQMTDAAAAFMQRKWQKVHKSASPEALENVGKWAKANTFEIFYTSLCAAMVYVLSRVFARHLDKKDETKDQVQASVPAAPASADTPPGKDISWQEKTSARTAPQKNESYTGAVDISRTGLAGQPAL